VILSLAREYGLALRVAGRCKFTRYECETVSVPLRDAGGGRAYRCILSEKELRKAYNNAR